MTDLFENFETDEVELDEIVKKIEENEVVLPTTEVEHKAKKKTKIKEVVLPVKEETITELRQRRIQENISKFNKQRGVN